MLLLGNAAVLKRNFLRLASKSSRKWPQLLFLLYLLTAVSPPLAVLPEGRQTLGVQTQPAAPGFKTLVAASWPPLAQPVPPLLVGGDAPLEPASTAQAYLVFERQSGQVALAKNPHQRLAPASLTKIATALAVLQRMELKQKVVVSPGALENSGGSLMGLQAGEEIQVQDLLWGLLLNSGNDAGQVLAENFPGGYSGLVQAMNELIDNLGLKNTHFNNSVGFDEASHYSSAWDLTLLTNWALRQPLFAQIVSTPARTVTGRISDPANPNSGGQVWHELKNTHPLLGQIPGAAGVKTGWTPQAGECLLTYLKTSQGEFLITVLGSQDRTADTRALIDLLQNSLDRGQSSA